MKYIEFGQKRDTVWVVEEDFGDTLASALVTRGYEDVKRPTKPAKSTEWASSVWEESRYLSQPYGDFDQPNRPSEVYMIMRNTGQPQPNQGTPVAASSNEDVADKVVDALNLAQPHHRYTVRPVVKPE